MHVGCYCNKTLQALPSGDGGMRVGKEKIMGIPRLEKELLAETGDKPCFVLAEHLGKLLPLTN